MIAAKTAALTTVVPDADASATTAQPVARYDVALGALRALVTLLVLAHHAALAYHPFAPPPPASLGSSPYWQAFPIVDAQRWSGFAWLVGFNDTFFMSLMFFLSGLFVWVSLRRRGSRGFLRERGLRLGLPFIVAAAVLAPLAYFPTYLQTGAEPSIAGFLGQWMALEHWPAGPVWFIWLLLAFDVLAAACFALAPRIQTKTRGALGNVMACLARHPLACFGLLVTLSATAYIPIALRAGPSAWSSFGPFHFQTSRLVHYAVYFFAGVAVGGIGIDRSLLAAGSRLAARWPLWLLACAATFAASVYAVISSMGPAGASELLQIVVALCFVVACAAASFAFLALFVRFAQRRTRLGDSLTSSAYGMFLVHYAVVSWLQYLLLPSSLSGLTKGVLVFGGTVALSWGMIAAVRRIPAVARVI